MMTWINKLWGYSLKVNQNKKSQARRLEIRRNHEGGNKRLFNDYFSEALVYTDGQFCQRNWMHKYAFLRIVETLGHHDEYLRLHNDAIGRSSLLATKMHWCYLYVDIWNIYRGWGWLFKNWWNHNIKVRWWV